MGVYSLRKSHQILKTGNNWYRKKGTLLSQNLLRQYEELLSSLDQAIIQGDKTSADVKAKEVETFYKAHFKKSIFQYASELIFAILIALIVATVVRQSWFELYEIPTGSMRPTFKEKDHLTVSKLAFGINTPLQTSHLYFDPSLVQRTSVVIFSGDKVPFIDQYTNFLGVFPYKKRYIKRLLGKPGDTVYFYGGKIYSMDKDGNFVKELLDSPWMEKIEHIPIISFEGMVSTPSPQRILFKQMQIPVGRITANNNGEIFGEIYNGKKWIKDQPQSLQTDHDSIVSYSDLWGIKNYALARLLTKQQLPKNVDMAADYAKDAVLFLELKHTPTLNFSQPKVERDARGIGVYLPTQTTYIPLKKEHLQDIMDNIYTARFVVENGRAKRYSVEDPSQNRNNAPLFPNVPDGTYEFYYGKAIEIGFGGIAHELPHNHPLYSQTPDNVQKLYNLGIEFDTIYSPTSSRFPSRYAYFRDGNLYLLGAPILKKNDETLITFLAKEQQRQTSEKQYVAFKDYGPPLKDGKIDKDFMNTFGLKIPDTHYLVLGDNHAMSSDSRVFGFIPQSNLQGAPSLIIWPPSDRIGFPKQKPYPIVNLPRIVIWTLALFIAICWYLYQRRCMSKPLFKRLYNNI